MNNSKIKNRTLPIDWGFKHRELEYTSDIFKDSDQVSSWVDSGHNPSVLKIELHQIKEIPEWLVYIKEYFPELDHLSMAFARFRPGTYFPYHHDRYGFFVKKYNIQDLKKIHRYILLVEDGAPGHYLQVENFVYNNWNKGMCVGWEGDTWHSAANLGMTDRYTLEITGIYNK